MILDAKGQAKELLPSKKIDGVEMTVIPTHGFEANGAMYLHWMSVRHWGKPGEWETNDAGLARSTDEGKSWTVLEGPRWSGESHFVQVSPVKLSAEGVDWIYFWGTTHGRFGGLKLMRVPEARVESARGVPVLHRHRRGRSARGGARAPSRPGSSWTTPWASCPSCGTSTWAAG